VPLPHEQSHRLWRNSTTILPQIREKQKESFCSIDPSFFATEFREILKLAAEVRVGSGEANLTN
jgi:hypothetical protein